MTENQVGDSSLRVVYQTEKDRILGFLRPEFGAFTELSYH